MRVNVTQELKAQHCKWNAKVAISHVLVDFKKHFNANPGKARDPGNANTTYGSGQSLECLVSVIEA